MIKLNKKGYVLQSAILVCAVLLVLLSGLSIAINKTSTSIGKMVKNNAIKLQMENSMYQLLNNLDGLEAGGDINTFTYSMAVTNSETGEVYDITIYCSNLHLNVSANKKDDLGNFQVESWGFTNVS